MGAFLPLYSVYSDCSTLSRKKQFFSKAATFSVLICVPADIRSRMLHVSLVDFLVCKRCFRCWLCDFLFSRQNGAERKQRPIFTFFPPPFSSHSARHRLLLLGYPLSGKSTHQLSNYKRKNCWIYKLSIYFSNARFHMLFGFRPASGRESVSLVCPHCRL